MSTPQFFAAAWNYDPLTIGACLALAGAYVWFTRLRSPWRAASWMAGLLLIALALVSPLDALAARYLFSAHMAVHIVFVLAVPALLLLGLPPGSFAPALRRPVLARIERFVATPAVAWMAGIGAMAFWHIPAVFHAALANHHLHPAEHLSLLAAGTVYWWPILSPRPGSRLHPVPQATAYLFSSCLACTAIGICITFASPALYPDYLHPADAYGFLPTIRQGWGISPALDQQIGGILMWAPCCLVYVSAIMAMFARWYAEERELPVEA